MIKNAAHRVADLFSSTARKRFGFAKLARDKRFKSLLDCNGFNGSELKFSPMRENPTVQDQRLLVAGRICLAVPAAISKLMDFVVLHSLGHSDRGQLCRAICVDV
jgi:hypothetical protein